MISSFSSTRKQSQKRKFSLISSQDTNKPKLQHAIAVDELAISNFKSLVESLKPAMKLSAEKGQCTVRIENNCRENLVSTGLISKVGRLFPGLAVYCSYHNSPYLSWFGAEASYGFFGELFAVSKENYFLLAVAALKTCCQSNAINFTHNPNGEFLCKTRDVFGYGDADLFNVEQMNRLLFPVDREIGFMLKLNSYTFCRSFVRLLQERECVTVSHLEYSLRRSFEVSIAPTNTIHEGTLGSHLRDILIKSRKKLEAFRLVIQKLELCLLAAAKKGATCKQFYSSDRFMSDPLVFRILKRFALYSKQNYLDNPTGIYISSVDFYRQFTFPITLSWDGAKNGLGYRLRKISNRAFSL